VKWLIGAVILVQQRDRRQAPPLRSLSFASTRSTVGSAPLRRFRAPPFPDSRRLQLADRLLRVSGVADGTQEPTAQGCSDNQISRIPLMIP